MGGWRPSVSDKAMSITFLHLGGRSGGGKAMNVCRVYWVYNGRPVDEKRLAVLLTSSPGSRWPDDGEGWPVTGPNTLTNKPEVYYE